MDGKPSTAYDPSSFYEGELKGTYIVQYAVYCYVQYTYGMHVCITNLFLVDSVRIHVHMYYGASLSDSLSCLFPPPSLTVHTAILYMCIQHINVQCMQH